MQDPWLCPACCLQRTQATQGTSWLTARPRGWPAVAVRVCVDLCHAPRCRRGYQTAPWCLRDCPWSLCDGLYSTCRTTCPAVRARSLRGLRPRLSAPVHWAHETQNKVGTVSPCGGFLFETLVHPIRSARTHTHTLAHANATFAGIPPLQHRKGGGCGVPTSSAAEGGPFHGRWNDVTLGRCCGLAQYREGASGGAASWKSQRAGIVRAWPSKRITRAVLGVASRAGAKLRSL